ncbi:MAG: hypothetical protein GY714_15280, partial [Desulfobacterales bacterium]|nr:hypothetical protein [Desulfobacterales bacterium]
LYLKNYVSNEKITIDLDLTQLISDKFSVTHENPVGVYSNLGENILGLFLISEKLFIWLNGEVLEFSNFEEISHKVDGDHRVLKMKFGKRDYISIYSITDSPISTQFYSEDDEDVDFGLWVHNVLSSKERTQSIFKRWRDGVS